MSVANWCRAASDIRSAGRANTTCTLAPRFARCRAATSPPPPLFPGPPRARNPGPGARILAAAEDLVCLPHQGKVFVGLDTLVEPRALTDPGEDDPRGQHRPDGIALGHGIARDDLLSRAQTRFA